MAFIYNFVLSEVR